MTETTKERYRATRRIKHDGTVYESGAHVWMIDRDARPLRDIRAVTAEPVEPMDAPESTAPPVAPLEVAPAEPGELTLGAVVEAIRGLDAEGYTKSAPRKPSTSAIEVALAADVQVSASLRDDAWAVLVKEGFKAPEITAQASIEGAAEGGAA